jgi:hypothetical protein
MAGADPWQVRQRTDGTDWLSAVRSLLEYGTRICKSVISKISRSGRPSSCQYRQ